MRASEREYTHNIRTSRSPTQSPLPHRPQRLSSITKLLASLILPFTPLIAQLTSLRVIPSQPGPLHRQPPALIFTAAILINVRCARLHRLQFMKLMHPLRPLRPQRPVRRIVENVRLPVLADEEGVRVRLVVGREGGVGGLA